MYLSVNGFEWDPEDKIKGFAAFSLENDMANGIAFHLAA